MQKNAFDDEHLEKFLHIELAICGTIFCFQQPYNSWQKSKYSLKYIGNNFCWNEKHLFDIQDDACLCTDVYIRRDRCSVWRYS